MPEYKPTVFYGQGIVTPKGHCTIMSFKKDCFPLPFFSNPKLSYEGEKLGDEWGYVNFNAKWIRENRFLLKGVGNEDKKCKMSEVMDWWPEWLECFTHKGVLDQKLIRCSSLPPLRWG